MNAATLDRDKLARVLGILGSDHDGEIAAAGCIAFAMVRAAGATWHDILAPHRAAPPRISADSDEGTIAACLAEAEGLTDWERQFLWSLRSQRYLLTPKQRVALAAIVEKVRRRTSARAE